jgi:hypothetical protein
MRTLPTIALAVLCTTSAASLPAQGGGRSAAARLVGTWRLVSFQSDSQTMASRGQRPTGLLIYDATGHMAVQIQPDRRRASWPQRLLPAPAQALDAVNGYAAYFGTYTVDEKAHTVTHHREGALNFDVVDYVRRYDFDAKGQLVLLPVDRPENQLVWERVK